MRSTPRSSGSLYPNPWFERELHRSLEVLILSFDPPVFGPLAGPRAGRAPHGTPRRDGVLNLRPPPQKWSRTVVVPHQVPQYPAVFEKSKPKRSALTTTAADRGESLGITGIVTLSNFARISPLVMLATFAFFLHRSSSSRRGQLGLGRQHQRRLPDNWRWQAVCGCRPRRHAGCVRNRGVSFGAVVRRQVRRVRRRGYQIRPNV